VRGLDRDPKGDSGIPKGGRARDAGGTSKVQQEGGFLIFAEVEKI